MWPLAYDVGVNGYANHDHKLINHSLREIAAPKLEPGESDWIELIAPSSFANTLVQLSRILYDDPNPPCTALWKFVVRGSPHD
jgi:hypothetical protein